MALFARSVRSSMASESSRQSPTVTSCSVPPLTTKMVAARRKAAAFHGPPCRRGITEGAEFSEAVRVSQLRHQWDQVLRRLRTEDPLQARADNIGTDQHECADPQVARQGHPAVGPLWSCPSQHRFPPIRVSCCVRPAGLPPLLPGVTGLFGQPAHQPDHPQPTLLLCSGLVDIERSGDHLGQHRLTRPFGRWPGPRWTSRGEPFPELPHVRADRRCSDTDPNPIVNDGHKF